MRKNMTVLYTMFIENSLIMEKKNESEYKQCGISKVVLNIKNIKCSFRIIQFL